MKRSNTENRGAGSRSTKPTGERAKHEAKDNPSHRLQRVEGQIRDVIAGYIIKNMRRQLPGIISVTRVIVASDIRAAKVMVTAMDPTGESGLDPIAYQKDAVEKLNLEAYAIQEEIDHTLRMKFCPKLTFVFDEGFEHAMKVENILRKISFDQAAKAPAGAVKPEDDGDESGEDEA